MSKKQPSHKRQSRTGALSPQEMGEYTSRNYGRDRHKEFVADGEKTRSLDGRQPTTRYFGPDDESDQPPAGMFAEAVDFIKPSNRG